jgi:hypothetical protein
MYANFSKPAKGNHSKILSVNSSSP